MAYLLLVEDREEDVELTLRALKKAQIDIDVVVKSDGVEAMAFLEGLAKNGQPARDVPLLVLLDISMPRMNGIQLLGNLRKLRYLRCVPVVMLTSSNEERDLIASYENGANSCVCKPVAFSDFSALIARLGEYWVSTNEVPAQGFPPS